ncbi:conserved hypothetical protein [Coccidioides posadasii str. Silveira]|uniref:Inner kinetochore subunit AME1 domain-containing protein n=1 Tax=Coccidioides posadasii (strain RMSCC 757 / Silveira) TaxID=443226 RepID=E9DCA9_COCPS|nr:conserved hypothetical protein [Coccidioides posadasii str. Silveira]
MGFTQLSFAKTTDVLLAARMLSSQKSFKEHASGASTKAIVATITMSIAANRAERQLMRQRGAANRKVKDVDFGFSFGPPQPLMKSETQVSQPAVTNPQSPKIFPPKSSTPNKKLSRPSTPGSRRSSARQTRSTPSTKPSGSSRGVIPSPASVYDIPQDDQPDQRSPKRRRITLFQSITADAALHTSSPHSEPRRIAAITETIEELIAGQQALPTASSELIHSTPDATLQPNEPPQHQTPLPSNAPPGHTPLPNTVSPDNNNRDNNYQETNEDIQAQRTPVAQRRRKKRKSVRLPPKNRQKRRSQVNTGSSKKTSKNLEPNEALNNAEQPFDQDKSRSPTVRRSSPPKERHTSVNPEVHRLDLQEERENDFPRNLELQNEEGERDHGYEVDEATRWRAPEGEQAYHPIESPQKAEQPERRRKRRKNATRAPASDKEPLQHHKEWPESTQPGQPENTRAVKPRRGRKRRSRGSSKSSGEAFPDEGTSSKSTIPVTVHRICNISALEDMLSDKSNVSDDEHSGSHNATRDHKYLNRGGINAADVLSQICQETLEKTISTLQTNIDRELNTTRANEWKRKCKVVQDFRSELENSLFGISELLESNLALAARLKRDKKEVLNLRHRLLSLRKEREEIALRIDNVRNKYADDESERMVQDSLNNSIHDLQLALDRSHKRKNATDANPFAGLEFLLRTVAQDVSSTASDSRGGLLNQVKQFNNQLEKTAALLQQNRQ